MNSSIAGLWQFRVIPKRFKCPCRNSAWRIESKALKQLLSAAFTLQLVSERCENQLNWRDGGVGAAIQGNVGLISSNFDYLRNARTSVLIPVELLLVLTFRRFISKHSRSDDLCFVTNDF